MDPGQEAVDVIQYAAQLGRLDFISALLATIALMLAAAAFPVFFYLRQRAKQAAEQVIEARIKEWERKFEAEVSAKMETLLPQIINDYMSMVRDIRETDRADEIAETQK